MKKVFDFQNLPYHEAFALMANGEEQADAFQELLYYTRRVCAVEGLSFDRATPNPDEIPMFCQLEMLAESGQKLDYGRLTIAWQDWNKHYRGLQRDNPVLELYDIMCWLVESHQGSSWLWGWEYVVCDWVEAGADPAHYPLHDGIGMVTTAFCQHLVQLRTTLHGWIHMDAIGNLVLNMDR